MLARGRYLAEPIRTMTAAALLAWPVDDRIDVDLVAELEAGRPASCSVVWYDDDRAMTGARA